MGDYGTSTGRRAARPADFVADADGRDARFTRTDDGYTDDREPRADQDEGEVDLLVYCTVAVPITIATPYTDDELAEIAGHEIGWSATFVSVDHVDVDAHDRAPGTIDPPRRPGRSFLDRLRRV